MEFFGEKLDLEQIQPSISWAFRVGPKGVEIAKRHFPNLQTVDGLQEVNRLLLAHTLIVFDNIERSDLPNQGEGLKVEDHDLSTYRRGMDWHYDCLKSTVPGDVFPFVFWAENGRSIPTEFRMGRDEATPYVHQHLPKRLVLFNDKKLEHRLPVSGDLLSVPNHISSLVWRQLSCQQ